MIQVNMQNIECDENNCSLCMLSGEYVYHCTNYACGIDLCVECILTSQLAMQKGIRNPCASEQWKISKGSNTDDINNNDPCLQNENNQVMHNNACTVNKRTMRTHMRIRFIFGHIK